MLSCEAVEVLDVGLVAVVFVEPRQRSQGCGMVSVAMDMG